MGTTDLPPEKSSFQDSYDQIKIEAGKNLLEEAYAGTNLLKKENAKGGTLPEGFAKVDEFFLFDSYIRGEGPYTSPDGKNRGSIDKKLDGTIEVWYITDASPANPIASVTVAPSGKPLAHFRLPEAPDKSAEIVLERAVEDGTNIKMTRSDGGQLVVNKYDGAVVNETCTVEERDRLRNDFLSGKSLSDLKPNHPGLKAKSDGSIVIGSGADEHLVFKPAWKPEAHTTPGDGKGAARRWNDTVADEFFRSGTFNNDEAGLAKTIATAQKELSKQEFGEFMGYIKDATKPYIKLDRGDDPLSKITVGDRLRVEGGDVQEIHRSNPEFDSTESKIKPTEKGVQVTDARGAITDVVLKQKDGKFLSLPGEIQEATMRNKAGEEIARVKTIDGKLTYDYKGADGKWQKAPIELEKAECTQDGSLIMHATDGRTFERSANGGLVHRNKEGLPELVEDGNSNVYKYDWSKIPDGFPVTPDFAKIREWIGTHPYQVTKVGPDTDWIEQTYTAKDFKEIAFDKTLAEVFRNPLQYLDLKKRTADLFAASDKYTVKQGEKCEPSTTAIGAALGFTPQGTPVQGTVGIAKPTQAEVSLSFNPNDLELTIQGQRLTTNEEIRDEDTKVVYRIDGTRTIETQKKAFLRGEEVTKRELDKNGKDRRANSVPKQ